MKKSAFILLIMLIIAGCAGSRKSSDCITDKEKDLVLSWGSIDNTTGELSQYSVTAKRLMFSTKINRNGQKFFGDSTLVPEENYCRTKQRFTELAAATQALWSPGDKQIFLEYKNPGRNVYFRATWNPEHTNYGNSELRGFYDSLMYKLTMEKL